jgi:hypothetical protein
VLGRACRLRRCPTRSESVRSAVRLPARNDAETAAVCKRGSSCSKPLRRHAADAVEAMMSGLPTTSNVCGMKDLIDPSQRSARPHAPPEAIIRAVRSLTDAGSLRHALARRHRTTRGCGIPGTWQRSVCARSTRGSSGSTRREAMAS